MSELHPDTGLAMAVSIAIELHAHGIVPMEEILDAFRGNGAAAASMGETELATSIRVMTERLAKGALPPYGHKRRA